MATEIAAKLRVTMAALGCHTRKQLALRFRARNPRTGCDVDSLHKWMQGRATPRHPGIYDELAALLGLSQGGTWVQACDLNGFVEAVAAVAGIPPAQLSRRAEATGSPRTTAAPTHGLVGGIGSLGGTYLCYSRALSPDYAGQVIRGALRLAPGGDLMLQAEYRETLSTGPVTMRGRAAISGRALHLSLLEPGSGVQILMILHVPGSPVTVLTGLLAAPALIASESLPSAAPFLAVRVAETDRHDARNRYFPLVPGAIAEDIAAAGLPLRDAAGLDRLAVGFLSPSPHQVPLALQTAFAAALGPVGASRPLG